MSNFDQLLIEAKNNLYKEEVVNEYFKLKKLLSSNEELNKLDKEMKLHQKLMCQNKNNDEVYLKEKKYYEDIKNKIEANPIWQNFQIIKEEVQTLLVDIKNILS